MNYLEASGHRMTYVAAAACIIYILALTITVLRKSWRRGLEIGYTKQRLWKIVKLSVAHAIVPAVTVLAGFFTLAPILGIPLSWLRLSVVGNTAYEIMATNSALTSAGVSDVGRAGAKEFTLIIYVMALGIMGGMVLSAILSRRIQRGIFKARQADRRWGALRVGTYMTTLTVAYTVPIFFNMSVALLTLLTGGAATLVLSWLRRKLGIRWLEDISFTLSVLVAMVSSLFWTRLLS
jgi:hypothetical protein